MEIWATHKIETNSRCVKGFITSLYVKITDNQPSLVFSIFPAYNIPLLILFGFKPTPHHLPVNHMPRDIHPGPQEIWAFFLLSPEGNTSGEQLIVME